MVNVLFTSLHEHAGKQLKIFHSKQLVSEDSTVAFTQSYSCYSCQFCPRPPTISLLASVMTKLSWIDNVIAKGKKTFKIVVWKNRLTKA